MIYRLEGRNEEAKSDFEVAAELGSAFAKVTKDYQVQLFLVSPLAH